MRHVLIVRFAEIFAHSFVLLRSQLGEVEVFAHSGLSELART